MADSHDLTPQPIPTELHSDYEERPFRICTRCGETLCDFVEGYQIAKVFRRGEVVFEYALCAPCHTGLVDEFSDESRQTLEKFYHENITIGLGSEACAICRCGRADLAEPEFTLGAVCHGTELLESLMICGACAEKSGSFISKKTQEVFGDFINDNFPGVPADALPSPTPITYF